MGMHQAGWRERNEERARESWEAATLGEVARLRAAADQLATAIQRQDAAAIIEALQDADAAGEAIFAARHGPENPADA